MAQLILPNRFKPRSYQEDVMAYLDRGGLRACCVWHRRGGKDTTAIHQIAKMAHQRRGLYWHLLPTQRQGRKVLWDAFTKTGERLIDQALPPILRKGVINNTEMKMNLKCGSMYQVVGADNYDALMGANPIGVVLSEWSLTDPRVWDFLRPILRENGGWAWFIYTPRGYNHGHTIAQIAQENDDWFYSFKPVNETNALTQEDIDAERRDGMPEELIQQEFYCSFSAANVGAILGHYVEKAEQDGRVSDAVELDPMGAEVAVSFDIGFRDTAAAWFWQPRPDGVALLDYQEATQTDASHWIDKLHDHPLPVKKVYLPHDARAKTFATKHSVLEQFLKSGFEIKVVPQVKIMDRINAARAVMPHARFNKTACANGLMALRDWSFEWDEVRKTFGKEPNHNWASHGGDSFTYGALVVMDLVRAWNDKVAASKPKPPATLPLIQGSHYTFSLEQLHEDAARMHRRMEI